MLDQAQLILAMHDSARYVADRYAFILAYLLRANLLVDSIMQGDNSAKAASGWNGSGQAPASYYSALWQYCQGFTQRLLQNYPNPFNGRSEISFEIPRSPEVGPRGSGPLHVRLRVFDLLGREISVLVDERKALGSYRISWDAGGLPSGVYFSSLEAGGQRLTRRMALVR
jgi:hypothetical protein